MPNIGVFHPQIVHFAITLCLVGVACRLIAFRGKPKFLNSAATLLIVGGAIATVLAVRSGSDAHGPVERIPGAGDAVTEHEEWGERARNVFIGIAALELIALAFMKKEGIATWIRIGSAVAGLVGAFFIYEASEHGGDLVYTYAGGVGTRSGDPADVTRLLIAGLHHKAALERREGRADEAARLTEEMARQSPNDPSVQLAYAQSLLTDRKDPHAALGRLAGIQVTGNPEIGKGMLLSDAYLMLGMPDSARMVLEPLAEKYPNARRIHGRLDSLSRVR